MAEATAEKQNINEVETFDHVLKLLEDSRSKLETELAGMPDEFYSRKPADGGWSINDVVEHLVILERRVTPMLEAKLPEQEVMPDRSNAHVRDAKLVKQVASQTVKLSAPDVTMPTGRYESCRQALDDFGVARQRTLDYTASATPYLRGRLLPHPFLGPLDGCQWLLAIGAHTQRHIKQIQQIKATLSSPSDSPRSS